jgi:hypothetical protein
VASAAIDCHGPPFRIELLTGSPLGLHAVDTDGIRTVSINGATLLAFLQLPDGSQEATGAAHLSAAGVWQYSHADDPLLLATARGVTDVLFVANLTGWLITDTVGNATCCSLAVPRPHAPGETLESLSMPPLRIARLFARNTGEQGGYGTGDSIEVTFARRTDRAGFTIGEILHRYELDQLLIFERELGPDVRAYAGVWRDDCSLLIVAGNSTGSPTPTTGIFTVRVRDDVFELRDAERLLHLASTAESPAMEGTFGAASGYAGRVDPLRATLPELAARRHIPHSWLTLEHLRTGPLPWHPVHKYDLSGDRRSECDTAYMEPDGRNTPPAADALPPYRTDDAHLRTIVLSAVQAMAAPVPSGLPFTLPPDGLPLDDEHHHEDPVGGHPRSTPPWTASDIARQHADRTAAAAVGPNAAVQRYFLSLGKAEHGDTFGLETARDRE